MATNDNILSGDDLAAMGAVLMSTLEGLGVVGPLSTISNRGQVVGQLSTDRSNYAQADGRIAIKTGRQPSSDIRLQAAGFKAAEISGDIQDVANTSAFTLQAALEVGSVSYPFTWQGQSSIVVTPGLVVYGSDILDGVSIPAGTSCFIRYNLSNGAWPEGARTNGGSGSANTYKHQYLLKAAGASQVFGTGAMSGGVNATVFGWAPFGLIGRFKQKIPTVILAGDSISDYQDDTDGDGFGNVCFLSRACWDVNGSELWPSLKLCRGQDSHIEFKTGSAGRRLAYRYGSHIIFEHGTNEIQGGLAALQTNALANWATARAAGLKVYQTSIIPRTNAANDAFASSGFAPGGTRDQFNTWAASRVGIELDGFINTSAAVEDPARPGYWLAEMAPTDGTHCLPVAQAAMAAVVRSYMAANFTV